MVFRYLNVSIELNNQIIKYIPRAQEIYVTSNPTRKGQISITSLKSTYIARDNFRKINPKIRIEPKCQPWWMKVLFLSTKWPV